MEAVVGAFKPHLKMALVKEGLKKIAAKFATLDHVGPKDVAEFDETLDEEERTIRQRDAFEQVNFLVNNWASPEGMEGSLDEGRAGASGLGNASAVFS